MQTIVRPRSSTVAPRATRSETVAAEVREMSRDELVERIRNSRTRSSAAVVEEQKRERRRRAEAAAARLRALRKSA